MNMLSGPQNLLGPTLTLDLPSPSLRGDFRLHPPSQGIWIPSNLERGIFNFRRSPEPRSNSISAFISDEKMDDIQVSGRLWRFCIIGNIDLKQAITHPTLHRSPSGNARWAGRES